ncbi:cytochrome-c oxidase, cbb3-type subunit III [Endozoicomonas sp. GU-1]|uniref:cytochrome-c oxidase, cbb3-type subunit III n=1 Tax=Endozoicomonas sp. GU-1 TaxID=3009078 RepID=UPI0022B582A7|nr:cytochrome-c oxidase, cbb3-type subunit III [Endozoicomonas sp. GU-1]WBA80282.1 cytochrome-c oxidase, cbb3-type subunit III [Endozoicomonas sp. GU-1]WBA87852.1 cytochrome-c oxidase, cbb3-type subunit III [Endozoicomonas sp. GU-1]
MSNFWHWWIVLLTTACLVLVTWVLFATRKGQRRDMTDETTGHAYDGIEEYDNPLPQWWFIMFIATLVFTVGYLILYPGMGKWAGVLGWTQVNELEQDQLKHDRKYAPEFARYAATPVEQLINNPRALKMGERVYINNCALCHGMDAGGNFGFPNLTDNDWLYGGTPDAIKATIAHGRQGQMPAWGAVIGDIGVKQVASYTRELSGIDSGASEADLAAGEKIFSTTCAVCHNADGTGNHALGAPNLTNNIWLYGSSQAQVEYTIRKGRNGVMPPWNDILGEEKVHLVTAYVYSLTHKAE